MNWSDEYIKYEKKVYLNAKKLRCLSTHVLEKEEIIKYNRVLQKLDENFDNKKEVGLVT